MISLKDHNDDSKSLTLKAELVLLLLRYTVKGLTVSDINKLVRNLTSSNYFSSLSRKTIKEYLYYLIEYDLICYDGTKHVFVINKSGISFLYIIAASIKKYSLDVKHMSIGFE